MQNKSNKLTKIYHSLLKVYGEQGWWPIYFDDDRVKKKTGYHQGDYSYPKDDLQKMEICIGSILTQNTNWNNVKLALDALNQHNFLNVDKILQSPQEKIARLIKSAGYFNQKSQYLKNLADFIAKNPFSELEKLNKDSIRHKLLKVKGIGFETADCILLYALNKPSFVVDAYTKRILSNLKLIKMEYNYQKVQKIIEDSLENDLILYQEFHALFVMHGKTHYQKKPYQIKDQLLTDGLI